MGDSPNAPETKICSMFWSMLRRVRSETVAQENSNTAKESDDTSRGHKGGYNSDCPARTVFPSGVTVLYCHLYPLESTCFESREREHYSALCRMYQHRLKFQQIRRFKW